MLAYFQNFLFTYLVFSNVIGYGYLLTFCLKQKENNFTFLFFNGTILIIFVSILINFFTPLHSNITNILFIIFTIIGSYKVYREIFYSHNFKLIIFVLLFASTIIFKSYPYNDYEFYHLPYVEILRNFKIIFGLSNFEFSYGYPSIFQNITALQYNLFMKLDSFIFYTPLLVSVLLGETFFKYIKLDNLIIKFLSYIFIVNFLIHANRYGSLGNDFPAHAISMFSYILFFSIIFIDKNNKKLYLFILTLIIAIFAKLTLLLNLLLIIPIFLFKRNILKLNTRTLIFILIVTFSIFLKNFINTSCLFFPISTTCFQTNWSAEKYDFSSAKMVNAYISALALGYKSLDNDISVGISPDGPKGPRHKVSNGIIHIARLSEKEIIPVGIGFKKKWILNTWDKFIIPKIFNEICFVWGKPIKVSKNSRESLKSKKDLEKLMNKLTIEANKNY